jgi:cholinesterase
VRYGAPPVGNLRFAAPKSPELGHPVFNNGSKAVTCIQAVPYWTNFTTAWVTNLTAAFNISAGYQPPNITYLPPQDPQEQEDCLFLDVMVPKKIFDNADGCNGAPVYSDPDPGAAANYANEIGWCGFMEAAIL